MQELFLNLAAAHPEKNIQRLTKKLAKKCSFKSGTDAANLKDLAYRLYVYGHEDSALAVCEIAHIPPPEAMKVDYRVWDFVLLIWGLEAYIWRSRGDTARAERINAGMQEVWLTPSGVFDTRQKRAEVIEKIRNRTTYERFCYQDEIAKSDAKSANSFKFAALCKMIGYGGFYPQVAARADELAADIARYKAQLREI